MPWTSRSYPVSMKNLPKRVRDKAIEIANALLEEGKMKEGIAIATSISRAKDWAANRGKKIENKNTNTRSRDVKEHGADWYVIPYAENSWAVKREGAARVEKVYKKKTEAVSAARKKHASRMLRLPFSQKKVKYSSANLTIPIGESGSY